MMAIFGLFGSYEDARTAVALLLERGAEVGEMNMLVQARAARAAMEINPRAGGCRCDG